MNEHPRKGTGLRGSAPRAPAARGAQRTSASSASDVEDEELTPEQLHDLRKRLEETRANVLASMEGRRQDERHTGREVGDEMDEANVEGAVGMASKLLERDARLLSEVDRALAKMAEGTYGVCEGTGEPIGYARLRLQPWARYSVEYQEELEHQARTRGGM